MTSQIIHGDALETLRTLPDCSVQMCVTSPPYYGLRDYGVAGQIGLEETPEEYIRRLVAVFTEVKRVLKDDGTLWVNIGDSYAGSRKGGATRPENAGNYKQGTNRGMIGQAAVTKVGYGGCKPKDLIGIPWLLAFALRDSGYYLRQDIIWLKPNAMPESVTDRCTKAHEDIFLLSKSRSYYFDADAIAEPSVKKPGKFSPDTSTRYGGKKYTQTPEVFNRTKSGNAYVYRPKRNKRSVWTVPSVAFKEAHFATFPPDLIRPCIRAGSRPGDIVLDPFFGSGTSGLVAIEEGREYVGIELNPEYVAMAERRLSGVAYQERLEI
jgi:DNA modification methylase